MNPDPPIPHCQSFALKITDHALTDPSWGAEACSSEGPGSFVRNLSPRWLFDNEGLRSSFWTIRQQTSWCPTDDTNEIMLGLSPTLAGSLSQVLRKLPNASSSSFPRWFRVHHLVLFCFGGGRKAHNRIDGASQCNEARAQQQGREIMPQRVIFSICGD